MSHATNWSLRQSYRTDDSVLRQRLASGTFRRVAGFARPFRFLLAGFLAVEVAGAMLFLLPPLLFKQIIDEGVLKGNADLVTRLALVTAGVALLYAAASL